MKLGYRERGTTRVEVRADPGELQDASLAQKQGRRHQRDGCAGRGAAAGGGRGRLPADPDRRRPSVRHVRRASTASRQDGKLMGADEFDADALAPGAGGHRPRHAGSRGARQPGRAPTAAAG